MANESATIHETVKAMEEVRKKLYHVIKERPSS
jgi:hypothetical protein